MPRPDRDRAVVPVPDRCLSSHRLFTPDRVGVEPRSRWSAGGPDPPQGAFHVRSDSLCAIQLAVLLLVGAADALASDIEVALFDFYADKAAAQICARHARGS